MEDKSDKIPHVLDEDYSLEIRVENGSPPVNVSPESNKDQPSGEGGEGELINIEDLEPDLNSIGRRIRSAFLRFRSFLRNMIRRISVRKRNASYNTQNINL